MGVLAPRNSQSQASSPIPLNMAPSWSGHEPWLLLCGLRSPVCEVGSSCWRRAVVGRWAGRGGRSALALSLPRARARRAPPSAAPAGSAASTCTWCSDTWPMGSCTIGAASGVSSAPTHCARAPTGPRRSQASSSVPATTPQTPLPAPSCRAWSPDSGGLSPWTPSARAPRRRPRRRLGGERQGQRPGPQPGSSWGPTRWSKALFSLRLALRPPPPPMSPWGARPGPGSQWVLWVAQPACV